MRRLFNAVAQELQGNLVPRQQNGRETSYGAYGGFGSFGGYGNGALGGLIGSLSQQPRPSNVPCPRKTPQAGHLDWIGLIDPRFSYFNVCPTCYNTQIRPTPFAGAFSTKPAAPPHLVLRCDMSRFWVRMAGLVLLTMNQDRRHDVTLLSRVSGISVQEGPCPNTHLDNEHAHQSRITRLWYSIRDPTTGGIPLPGWTICSHCVVSIQTMSPAIASAFVPTSQVPTEGSCALIPSDSFDDAYSAQQLQYIATCAVYSSQAGRPNMTPLITWLKENPPPTRGAVPGRSWEAPAGPCPRDYASVTVKCYVMGEIPDFTVCEKCFAEVVKPDMDRGAELARRFGTEARAVPTGFTCQLYSNRMRHVWSQTVSSGNVEILRQKVGPPELSMSQCSDSHQGRSLKDASRKQSTSSRSPL